MKVKVRKLIVLAMVCSLLFGNMGMNCIVPIQAKQTKKVKSIKLNYAKKTLKVGEKVKLKVKKVKPKGASKKVKWKSKNKSIASVSKKGVVLAKKSGTVKIVAISKKRKKVKAYCKVTVVDQKQETTTSEQVVTSKQDETTGTIVTPTQAEETTSGVEIPTQQESTTTVVEPSTQEETTSVVEPSTQEETTSVVEPSTQEETTSVVEPSTQEETTSVVESSTQIGETTVVEPSTQIEETTNQQDVMPSKPEGLACVSGSEGSYYFVWQPSENTVTYNFYVDGINVASGLTIYAYLYNQELSAGRHVIGVSAVNENGESDIYEIDYFVEEHETTPKTFTVTFKDYDGKILKTEEVEKGGSATAPEQPSRNGFRFVSWDRAFTNVEEEIVVNALYEEITVPLLYGEKVEIDSESDSDIVVPISVKNNPGVLGMTLSISYDENRFTMTGYEIGDAVKGILTLTGSNVLNSGCKFVYDGQELSSENIKDGQILLLKFRKKVGIWSSESPVTISYTNGDIIDYELNPISFMIQNGSISIK